MIKVLKNKIVLFALGFIVAILTYSLLINNCFANKESKKVVVNSTGKFAYDKLFNDVIDIIKKRHIEVVSDDKILEGALNGVLQSLDPHSAYLNPEQYKEMLIKTKGEFGGIGIEITTENQLVKVITSIDDTPAQKAGIQSGDYITSIESEPVFGLSIHDVVKKLRGEPGSFVKFTVIREGIDKPLEFKLKREEINVKSVKYRMEASSIGYIRISSFTENSTQEVKSAITKLKAEAGNKGLSGIVLDLRNNPGGLLNQSVEISDIFLDKGKKILSIKGRADKNLDQDFYDEEDESLTKSIPTAVLINEGSASASEIVAGALQDNKRAIVIGTRSFGKGSVQTIGELSNGGGIKITIARYYTPSGRSIQADGVNPDIIVKNAKIVLESESDKTSEANLPNHLKKEIEKQKSNKQLSTNNESMYDKDYQLARAIDLLLGLKFVSGNVN